jgi:uncharacterized membrane protein
MPNPFSLPLHPALVHFPLAMLTATWACTLVRYATGDLRWDERARLFEVVGVVSLPFVIAAAFVDTRGFGFVLRPRFDAPLVWHMVAGLAATGAFTWHLLWRRRIHASKVVGRLAVQEVVLVSTGMAALLAAGLIAGEMVYGS